MTEIILLEPRDLDFDLFIGCVGYEHRSLAALRKLRDGDFGGNALLFDYDSGDLFSYVSNMRYVAETDATTVPEFGDFEKSINEVLDRGDSLNILFDVTSFDREKIATLLQLFFRQRSQVSSVTICYFPRDFVEPSYSLDILRSFGPVTPAFIGQSSFSRDSLALIIGAGYEYGRAIGAIDLLEPDRVYCMTPVGTDKRFESAIRKNNLDFSFLDDESLLRDYDLLRPESLFYELRRMVEFELQERNVLILPLGPKIFAAISILVALILHPDVMVWRHSTASKHAPNSTSDAKASGVDVRLTFSFTQ
jgi:hypothetical protein